LGIVSHLADFLGKRSTGIATPEEYDQAKQAGLERVLGSMHGYVGHAIIPYAIGGPVDMYYFAQSDGGTAFATMELLTYDGKGPAKSDVGTYELVAFTRHPVVVPEESAPFDAIENRIRSIFTSLGNFSTEAVLNAGDTAEVPMSEGEPNACLLLGSYEKPGTPFMIGKKRHGLLLVTEIFANEMAVAREHGSSELIARLKAAGAYPYSDLDRKSVADT
jgi:hypothetical protein